MEYKIGVTQWSLPGNGILAVKLASMAGVDGLQLELGTYERGFFLNQKRIQDLYLEEGEKYNIEYPSISLNELGVYGMPNDKDSEKGKIAYQIIEMGIAAAKRMEINTVTVPSFFNSDIKSEDDFISTTAALRYCCQLATEEDVIVASETTLNSKDQIKLMEMVNMPNLHVFYDTQNYKLFKDFDQLEILSALYPYMIPQIHVKDGNGDLSGATIGQGNTDCLKSISYLKEKGYKGWYIFENYYDQLPLRAQAEDQIELLIKDIEILKDWLK